MKLPYYRHSAVVNWHRPNLNEVILNRFSRQEILNEFGPEGQEKLRRSKVLVIGAGGLGCPAILYLAAVGVGTLGVIDGDVVSISNLNRQILFGIQDVGINKAERAVEKLKTLYPDIQFRSYAYFLDKQCIFDLFNQYDLIVDGSDNFPTRYLVNDACVILNKPLVMGAIYQSEGQLAVFNHGEDAVQYRDLYPRIPGEGEVPNCSETGVLGVLPGIIGSMQAAEAIKIISGYGRPLHHKVLFYTLKTASFYELEIPVRKDKSYPRTKEELLATQYDVPCGTVAEITWQVALDWLERPETAIWDIREKGEEPKIKHSKLQEKPLSMMDIEAPIEPSVENILLFCHSGVRSLKVGQALQTAHPKVNFYPIQGGICQAPPAILSSELKD